MWRIPAPGFLMTAGFYLVQKIVYYIVARGMAGVDMQVDLPHAFGAAAANGFLAIVLFSLLDKASSARSLYQYPVCRGT